MNMNEFKLKLKLKQVLTDEEYDYVWDCIHRAKQTSGVISGKNLGIIFDRIRTIL